MIMIKELTKKYVAAFDSKSIDLIAELLDDSFVLEDPVVKRIKGKEKSLMAISNIFEANDSVTFCAKNIFVDGSCSIIEFNLQLGDTILTGVDIIEWENNNMTELRAYFDIPK